MDEILLRKLIEKDHFKVSTEVDARARGCDLSGRATVAFVDTYTVAKLLENRRTGRLVMELISARDGNSIKVQCESITMIDGMTPERFAENYMIAPDGTDIKIVGKRRGRRPKNWTPDMENEG